jgi:hypothetical protein
MHQGGAEEFFSRMRRAEIGHHHHIAGAYLVRYAHEAAWREDHRRMDSGRRVQDEMGVGDGVQAVRGLVRVSAASTECTVASLSDPCYVMCWRSETRPR